MKKITTLIIVCVSALNLGAAYLYTLGPKVEIKTIKETIYECEKEIVCEDLQGGYDCSMYILDNMKENSLKAATITLIDDYNYVIEYKHKTGIKKKYHYSNE